MKPSEHTQLPKHSFITSFMGGHFIGRVPPIISGIAVNTCAIHMEAYENSLYRSTHLSKNFVSINSLSSYNNE